jgi:hypothetical protein
MPTIPQDKLDELRAAHGDIWTMYVGDTEIALRTPPTADYERFVEKAASADKKGLVSVGRALALASVVFPDAASWSALVAKHPGLAMTVAGEATNIAALAEKDAVKR